MHCQIEFSVIYKDSIEFKGTDQSDLYILDKRG